MRAWDLTVHWHKLGWNWAEIPGLSRTSPCQTKADLLLVWTNQNSEFKVLSNLSFRPVSYKQIWRSLYPCEIQKNVRPSDSQWPDDCFEPWKCFKILELGLLSLFKQLPLAQIWLKIKNVCVHQLANDQTIVLGRILKIFYIGAAHKAYCLLNIFTRVWDINMHYGRHLFISECGNILP